MQIEERGRANGGNIQSRPLPDLPEKEMVPPLPKLQMRFPFEMEIIRRIVVLKTLFKDQRK